MITINVKMITQKWKIKRSNVDINGNFQFNFNMIVNKVFLFY